MIKQNVVILGGSGMLGSMLVKYFLKDEKFNVTATARTPELLEKCSNAMPQAEWMLFEIRGPEETAVQIDWLPDADWLVNAIGITKPYVHDDNASEVERAIMVNSLFPHLLGKAFDNKPTRVLQIATDCVFSGEKGNYGESDKHDPTDVYGKTKSLGEAYFENIHHLRCSIIGPEYKSQAFLQEWFLNQPENAQVNGFTNHDWNGVTTLHFAKICSGIILSPPKLGHIQHIIPGNKVNKYKLLKIFAENYNRKDIKITPIDAGVKIDRTLKTEDEALNRKIWALAGYDAPPTIQLMLRELAEEGGWAVG